MGERRESARFGILTNQFLSSPVFWDKCAQLSRPLLLACSIFLENAVASPTARGRAVASDRSECVWLKSRECEIRNAWPARGA